MTAGVTARDGFARWAGPVLAVAALLALAAHLRIRGGVIDDAWITFRYAANLAQGQGMVYNPGERVLGTTTPGWASILGGFGALAGAGSIPLIARVLNGLLALACGAAAGLLGRRLTGSVLIGALAGAAVMVAPYTLLSGASGMESTLLNALVLGALLARVHGRWGLAAGLAGAAPLVRPEGALIVAIIGVEWLVSTWRRPGSEFRSPAEPTAAARSLVPPALLLLPGLALLAWIRLTYGGFVPQSVRAKQAGIYPLSIAESTAEAVGSLARTVPGGGLLHGVIPGLHLIVLALGSAWLLRRSRALWPFVALLWVPLAFYGTSRTIIFPHYIALMEPFALLAWGAALYGGAMLVFGGMRSGERTDGGDAMEESAEGPTDLEPIGADAAARRSAIAIAVGALLVAHALLLYPWASTAAGEPRLEDDAVSLPAIRMAFYQAASDVVGPAIPPGTEILMPEIGVLGFRLSQARILDAVGLVSPEAVPFLPVPPDRRVGNGIGAIPAGLVDQERPELIMTLEMFARRSLYEEPWFEEAYETVWIWQAEDLVWGPLRIHALRGSRTGAALRERPGGIAAPS